MFQFSSEITFPGTVGLCASYGKTYYAKKLPLPIKLFTLSLRITHHKAAHYPEPKILEDFVFFCLYNVHFNYSPAEKVPEIPYSNRSLYFPLLAK
jgi:hypothetical protein